MSQESSKLAELIIERSFRKVTKTAEVLRVAILHEMTCDDQSHMHGVIKIRWEKPKGGQS